MHSLIAVFSIDIATWNAAIILSEMREIEVLNLGKGIGQSIHVQVFFPPLLLISFVFFFIFLISRFKLLGAYGISVVDVTCEPYILSNNFSKYQL